MAIMMNNNKRHLANNEGVALISVLLVVVVVGILLTSYLATVISEHRRITHEIATGSAEYIARAGLEEAFFDLSCEYDKDKDWTDDNFINDRIINNDGAVGYIIPPEGMPDVASDDGTGQSSSPQVFYPTTDFEKGQYTVSFKFIKEGCPGPTCAFAKSRVWVLSTGRVLDEARTKVIDEVTLTQLARVRLVKNITIDFGVGRLYDTVQPANNEANVDDEIRISGATIYEDAVIGDRDLLIRGGYGYSFSDESRDTDMNKSILKDASGTGVNTAMSITGSGTITMGGVRIE